MELVSFRINNKIPIGRKCYLKKDIIFASNPSFKIVDDFIVKQSYMNIANLAASNNLFGLLKYLKFKGIRADDGDKGLIKVIENGNLKMIKYLMDRKYKLRKIQVVYFTNDIFLLIAIENGHFEIVKYLYSKGYRTYQRGIRIAYLKGHLDIVEYLEKKSLILTKEERKYIDNFPNYYKTKKYPEYPNYFKEMNN